MKWRLSSVVTVSVLLQLAAPAALRFVKQDAIGANNGSSWENAHTSLAAAIDVAASGDELWVAHGTHLPTIEANGANMEPGPRAASFGVIGKSLKLYGGFNGAETARSERDWVVNRTILSGDLGAPGDPSDNAYTVLHSYTGTLTVDGFTIRDGNSDGTALGTANDFDGNGGAVFQNGGSMTFANCQIHDNYASYGGAMYLISGSITLLNCSFVNNSARWVGGAIDGRGSQTHRISHCTFAGNSASRGAAFTFDGNSATTTVTNCLFAGNSGGGWPYFEVSFNLTASRNILQQTLDGQPDNLVAGALFAVNDNPAEQVVRRLRAGSPGVDYGNTAGIFRDVTDMDGDSDTAEPLPLDILGVPRPTEMPSAGAFQYVNLPPTQLTITDATIEENRPSGTRVGFFNTEDPNTGEFIYTLVAGVGDADNSAFSIDGNRLKSAQEFDYEAKSSFQIRVRSTDVSDGLGQFIEETFSISILDSIDQTLTIEAVDPIAYEPRGGLVEGFPHLGMVRIERVGDISAPLSVGFSVNSSVPAQGDEFLIRPEPPAVLEFAAGEAVLEFTVLPLFDQDGPDPDEDDEPDTDQVWFTLTASPLEYALINASATVHIFDSPGEGWSFMQQQAGLDSNLVNYLLADPTAPGGFVQPSFTLDSVDGLTATVSIDRTVLDYQMGVEVSDDLITWEPASIEPTMIAQDAFRETLRYSIGGGAAARKFMRLRAEQIGRPDDFAIENLGMALAGIPAGNFSFGSSNAEAGRGIDEGPVTNVQLSVPFWMATTEVTQAQYKAVVGSSPNGNNFTDFPVRNITFTEATQFASMLTSIERAAGRLPEGYLYRLPTEAEWEYASRAGSSTPHFFGDPAGVGLHGWYLGNSFLSVREVGLKLPNAWGIHDTVGNVSEWCLDIYQPAYPGGVVFDPLLGEAGLPRSIRGGHYYQPVENQRSAFRAQAEPDFHSSLLGFRIVLAFPPGPGFF